MRILLIVLLFVYLPGLSQSKGGKFRSFVIRDSVKVLIDMPLHFKLGRSTIVVFYALPNGNTTAQTMGRKMQPGDDWHFDIQHIEAQTRFIRKKQKKTNIFVVYLENQYKSWPLWKQRHPDFKTYYPHIVDSIVSILPGKDKSIYLNGHSGGGSFIFGWLAGVNKIPSRVKRISFLDSNYGYDSSYYPVLSNWLKEVKDASLNVFAYNDSVVIYNGKPLVSPTGGTWYRSRLMLKHFSDDFNLHPSAHDSVAVFKSPDERIQFFLKDNPRGVIYHTRQVEYNGFIHSFFAGTRYDSRRYRYFGERAYKHLIK